MKLRRTFFTALILLLVLSCSEENDPNIEEAGNEEQVNDSSEEEEASIEEIVYFTYQNLEIGGLENWIIIHDENGDLVDFKQITEVGSTTFTIGEDVMPDNLSVTKLSYSSDLAGNNLYHRLLTYTDLEVGSVWEDRLGSFEGNLVGNFNLQVTNLSGVENILITAQGGTLRFGNANADEFEGNTLQLNAIPLYEEQEYLISIRDSNGLSKYLFLTPQNGIDYSFDYDGFQEFDDTLEVELPPNDFNIMFTGGFKTNDWNTYQNFGHNFTEYIGYGDGVFNLGYIDGYERYRTLISLTRDDFTYTFGTIGEKLQNISFPDRPSFMVENTSIYDLRFSIGLNFITKNTRHESTIVDEQSRFLSTVWEVFSTGTFSQKVGQLPVEIVERYPDMVLEDLELKKVSLFTDGYEQQQFFEDMTSKRRMGNYTFENYEFRGF